MEIITITIIGLAIFIIGFFVGSTKPDYDSNDFEKKKKTFKAYAIVSTEEEYQFFPFAGLVAKIYESKMTKETDQILSSAIFLKKEDAEILHKLGRAKKVTKIIECEIIIKN